MCCQCLRHSHLDSPFHKVEWWTGTYFHAAELWEVGCYILVQHQHGLPLCNILKGQQQILEECQHPKDLQEQTQLCQLPGNSHPNDMPNNYQVASDWPMEDSNFNGTTHSDDNGDDTFLVYLDKLLAGDQQDTETNLEPNDNVLMTDADTEVTISPYLQVLESDTPGPQPRADIFLNAYVLVVHTNGIHNLALVSCQCQGDNQLPLDLVVSRLWPTSFQKIWTLFTDQLLWYFCLANLELKASAYQFYHLL